MVIELTNTGRLMLLEASTDTNIVFTKIKYGRGSGDTMALISGFEISLNTSSNIVKSWELANPPASSYVELKGSCSNSSINASVWVTQIGVYAYLASDSTQEEKLFAYKYLGDSGKFIVPAQSDYQFTLNESVVFAVGDMENFSLRITTSAQNEEYTEHVLTAYYDVVSGSSNNYTTQLLGSGTDITQRPEEDDKPPHNISAETLGVGDFKGKTQTTILPLGDLTDSSTDIGTVATTVTDGTRTTFRPNKTDTIKNAIKKLWSGVNLAFTHIFSTVTATSSEGNPHGINLTSYITSTYANSNYAKKYSDVISVDTTDTIYKGAVSGWMGKFVVFNGSAALTVYLDKTSTGFNAWGSGTYYEFEILNKSGKTLTIKTNSTYMLVSHAGDTSSGAGTGIAKSSISVLQNNVVGFKYIGDNYWVVTGV